ncbi:hypothetical protein EQP59_05455 [Ornithobacterium rhinotracheale]|uniref:Uncharacterized protein n=1 Tax=Ornithobacterium rhinotracheale TaxID=28251 RepID=A0A3R5Y3H8_ORNRH|nr:hypothetical protein [Ornithobacterium rhinotracheale]QAR30820.1 hypothetical protein EQP59_05455 [Ornithobacterium rhinotracheale]
MKNIYLSFAFVAISLIACKSENQEEGVLSPEDIASIEETSTSSVNKIHFDGKYEGNVHGEKYDLNLNDEDFTLNYGNEKFEGKAYINGDGTCIELEPKSGNLTYKILTWVDENQLSVLDENGDYPEPEIFLNRK